MAVHWTPLKDGVKIPEADHTGRVYVGNQQKKPGTGKKKCECGYRVKGPNHEDGYHHNHPKQKH